MRLTEVPDWIEDARALLRAGASYGEIAAEIGEPYSVVSYWLNQGSRGRERQCRREGCARMFLSYNSTQAYCSARCWRLDNPGVSSLKRASLKRPTRQRRDRAAAQRFQDPAKRCRRCGGKGQNHHHVVYAQVVRREGGDLWDPRNALKLCLDCHAAHHQRGRVLSVRVLRDENIEFALELFGVGRGIAYLDRYYKDALDDPRVQERAAAA